MSAGALHYIENPGWVCGGALEWLRALLRIADFTAFDLLAADAPPGSDGLQLPAGPDGRHDARVDRRRARLLLRPDPVPWRRPSGARGVGRHAPSGMRDVTERLRQLGVAAGRCASWAAAPRAGCGRRSAPMSRAAGGALGVSDTSAVGAAILAAVAAGRVRDVAAGAAAAGAVADVIEPQAALRGIYDDMYGRYRRLFDSLKPMFAG